MKHEDSYTQFLEKKQLNIIEQKPFTDLGLSRQELK
jgi:hypothetical protein